LSHITLGNYSQRNALEKWQTVIERVRHILTEKAGKIDRTPVGNLSTQREQTILTTYYQLGGSAHDLFS